MEVQNVYFKTEVLLGFKEAWIYNVGFCLEEQNKSFEEFIDF